MRNVLVLAAAAASVVSVASPVQAVADGATPYWQRETTLVTGYHPETVARESPRGRLVLVYASSTSGGTVGDWAVRYRLLGPQGWSAPRTVTTVRHVHGWLALGAAVSNDRVVTVVGRPGSASEQPRLELREQYYGGRTASVRTLGRATDPDVAIDPAGTVAVVARATAFRTTEIGGWTVSRAGRVLAGLADTQHSTATSVNVDSAPHVFVLRTGLFGLTYLQYDSDLGTSTVEGTEIVGSTWSRGAETQDYNAVTSYGAASAGGQAIIVSGTIEDTPSGRSQLVVFGEDEQGDYFAGTPAATYYRARPSLDREVSAYAGFQRAFVAVVGLRAYLSDSWGQDWIEAPPLPVTRPMCGGGVASSAFSGGMLTWFASVAAAHGRCSVVGFGLHNLY